MKIKRCLCLALVSLLCLSACSGPAANEAATNAPETTKQESSAGQTEAPQTTAPAETPGDVVVTMPVASRANGVITAEEWSEMFPEIYASYMANQNNSETIDHVKEYPQIAVLYEGMAFNQFYNSARGHVYTLEDIDATGRPHPLANCLTCKTPDYTALVNATGVEAYKLEFEEVRAQIDEPVSCYNCHANEANTGKLVVTHQYLADAMGSEIGGIDAAVLSCAQCHNEYYFDPETKATTLPYSGVEAMHPDAILAYYNQMGFSDYTNPRTGTQMIKVQHPEFETYMGEGGVIRNDFSCAGCHMGATTSDTGVTYTSHEWTSPLKNEAMIENSCQSCHDGEKLAELVEFVTEIQEEVEGRTIKIADDLVALTEKLAEAVSSGDYTDEELDAIRALNRDAQFYWDFVFVENSEGAHNSKLSHYCLDKAESLCAEATALFH